MYTTLVTICQTANLGKVLRWYLILEQIFYIRDGFIPIIEVKNLFREQHNRNRSLIYRV